MKALKIIGIVVGALVVLFLLALAIVPKVIPWESMVSEGIAEATGRQVSLESLDVGLFGGVDVQLKGLVIKDKPAYGERPLVVLKSVDLQASLWPLLASKVLIEKITVDGLEVSVVRGKDGMLNWQDMPPSREGEDRDKDKHEVSVGAQAGDDSAFVLGLAQMTNSTVFLKNLANGKESSIPIEKFTATTAAPGAQISGRMELALPGLAMDAQGKSKGLDALESSRFNFKLDLAELGKKLVPLYPELEARGVLTITAQAQGPANALALTVDGAAKDLYVDCHQEGSKPFQLADLTLKVDLTHDQDQELTTVRTGRLASQAAGMDYTFVGVVGTGKSLGKTDARLLQKTTDLGKFMSVINPFLDKPIKAAGRGEKETVLKGVDEDTLKITGTNWAKDVVVQTAALAEPFREQSLTVQYDATVTMKGDKDFSAQLDKLDIDSGIGKLGATGKLAVKGKDTALLVKVDAPFLDLDKLPKFAEAKPVPAVKAAAKAAAPAPAGEQKAEAPKPAAREKKDLDEVRENLKHVDIDIQVNVERLMASGYEIDDLAFAAKVRDLVAQIEKLACKVLEGQVDMSAGVDFKPEQPVTNLKAKIDKLHIEPKVFKKLQQDFPAFSLPLSSLSGVFDFDTELMAKGLDEQTFLKTMNAHGRLAADDGVTVGLAFLDKMPGGGALWRQILPNIPREFAKMEAKYKVADALADFDVNLVSGRDKKQVAGKEQNVDQVDMTVKGRTELLTQKLEGKIIITGDALGPTFKEMLGQDGTLPIGLGGTVSDPKPTVDLSALTRRAGEQLIKRGIMDGLKEGSKEGGAAEGLLKGILGR